MMATDAAKQLSKDSDVIQLMSETWVDVDWRGQGWADLMAMSASSKITVSPYFPMIWTILHELRRSLHLPFCTLRFGSEH